MIEFVYEIAHKIEIEIDLEIFHKIVLMLKFSPRLPPKLEGLQELRVG